MLIDDVIEEILALHTPVDGDPDAYWKSKKYYEMWGVELSCSECDKDYPCKTVQIVDEDATHDKAKAEFMRKLSA